MNNVPSLNEINKTAKMNPNLLTRHYKLKLMNDFMYIKYQNPKMKQFQIADQLNLSPTIQRYRNDINMLSPYRINPNNINKRTKRVKNTGFDDDSHTNNDLKRPQMISNDIKTTETKSNKKNKTVLKAGSMHENVEINEHYLDGILQNNNCLMELAMQIISYDKTVRSDTIQDLKEFNSQSLSTQAKKGEQLVSMMPAIKKVFNLLGDGIVELSTENEALKNKIGSYDKNC